MGDGRQCAFKATLRCCLAGKVAGAIVSTTGGRTATTYVSGTLEMPWARRFLPADTTAGLVWSIYASALGYFGGATFEHNLWAPLLIATAASLLVAAAGELARRRGLRRRATDSTRP